MSLRGTRAADAPGRYLDSVTRPGWGLPGGKTRSMVGVDARAEVQSGAPRLAIIRWAALVTGAVLAANALTQAIRGLMTVRSGMPIDFVAFADASRLLVEGSRCLYCSAPQHAVESAYLGVARPAFVAFLNPPIVAVVLVPLAELPRTVGLGLFLVLSTLAMGAGGWLLVARLRCPVRPTVLAVLSLPAAITLYKGQWDGLLLLALVAALVLLERRPVLAGLLLSALAIKVQAVWLVPVVLVALGRWRVLAGMAVGAAVLIGSDIAMLGPHWLDWPHAMFQTTSDQATWNIGLASIPAYLGGNGAGLLASAVLGIAAVPAIFGLRGRLRSDPSLAVAAAVCISLLLGPHTLPYDLLLVAPALALAGRRLPLASAAAALLLSVAYLVGALPSALFNLDAYVPALALTAAVVLVVVVRRPWGPNAGLVPSS
jgi:alpha-1,2-mannosyltransferase